jgi:hypothetical protein
MSEPTREVVRMITTNEAIAEIEAVLKRWLPGTFANGYVMAAWLQARGERIYVETSDAESEFE